MSVAAAKGAHQFGLRNQREPGHFWADNEIFDVFGDQLGPNGILLYITMTRLCWGPDVRASLREIAAQARMSKSTVARTMGLLVKIGLIAELRGDKAKTPSAYTMINVKRLAAHYVAQRLETPESAPRSVPDGDRGKTAPVELTPNSCKEKTSPPLPTLVELLCPPGGTGGERGCVRCKPLWKSCG